MYIIYPSVRDAVLFLRLWSHTGRQEYHVAYVKDGVTLEEVRGILDSCGYEHSICSWIDDGEVLSMRKIEGKFQYHLRLFEDGELRGHYEYAPEFGPIKHLIETVFEPREKYFKEIFVEVLA